MIRKTCAITGATGGIGHALANALAERGYDLVLHGRSPHKLEALKATLLTGHDELKVTLVTGDLEGAGGAQRVAGEIAAAAPILHLLINNAGILSENAEVSPDGLDMHMQVNLVAPFILMQLLKPCLAATGGTIVNVSSGAVFRARSLSAKILRHPSTDRKLFGAYAESKLAQAVLGKSLADEFAKDRIAIVSADPGPTKTSMTASDAMPKLLKLLRPLLYRPPERGAANILHATDDAVRHNRLGAYFTKGREKQLPDFASDQTIAADVLKFCAEHSGLAGRGAGA